MCVYVHKYAENNSKYNKSLDKLTTPACDCNIEKAFAFCQHSSKNRVDIGSIAQIFQSLHSTHLPCEFECDLRAKNSQDKHIFMSEPASTFLR